MIIFILILLAILAFGLNQAKKQKKFYADQAVPKYAMKFEYEGGHPELQIPGEVKMWGAEDGLHIASWPSKKSILVPQADIITLSLENNVQNVNVGGGRSIGGALVGAAVAGPVGALVGGRSSGQVKRVDESKTYLVVQYGKLQMQMIFKGGPDTYRKLSILFARMEH